jgi:hypothetical protein
MNRASDACLRRFSVHIHDKFRNHGADSDSQWWGNHFVCERSSVTYGIKFIECLRAFRNSNRRLWHDELHHYGYELRRFDHGFDLNHRK